MIEIIHTKKAPKAIGPYSQACCFGNMIYTSGQIALRADGDMDNGDINSQTRQVLENLAAVLESAGADFDSVVKTTIFLTNMDHFSAVNAIYAEFFKDAKPARSTVAVKELPKNALVEIECIAIKKA